MRTSPATWAVAVEFRAETRDVAGFEAELA